MRSELISRCRKDRRSYYASLMSRRGMLLVSDDRKSQILPAPFMDPWNLAHERPSRRVFFSLRCLGAGPGAAASFRKESELDCAPTGLRVLPFWSSAARSSASLRLMTLRDCRDCLAVHLVVVVVVVVIVEDEAVRQVLSVGAEFNPAAGVDAVKSFCFCSCCVNSKNRNTVSAVLQPCRSAALLAPASFAQQFSRDACPVHSSPVNACTCCSRDYRASCPPRSRGDMRFWR